MPHLPFAAGEVVQVRGNQWIVQETVAFSDCTLLRLTGISAANHNRDWKLLYPFDRPMRQESHRSLRVASRRLWGHALHAHLSGCHQFQQLRAASSASIDILPFQLEPALAIVRGMGSRVLLADEVGLGKTIQAGLILAELQKRGWCERALILTPAGLREQWADELAQRFGIRASIFDTAALRIMTGAIPLGLNPWAVQEVAITSLDFVKQPEVLKALTSLLWDVVIVDEAHQVPTAPQRAGAVRALAERSRHVVLLTATPHSGDPLAYDALCAIGQVHADDPLIMFRRTRRDVGHQQRRHVHLLPVRLSDQEHEMHQRLHNYVARVWEIGHTHDRPELQLVAMVLSKRAFSSASSLAASLERRICLLEGRAVPSTQAGLPFNEEEDAGDAIPNLELPAFERTDEELTALRAILVAASLARRHERKLHVLQRLLRRVREPVVVFTEYRDTLHALEESCRFRNPVLLHGGLTRLQRRAAVEAFTRGSAGAMLATDAGSEGLNLQSRCRLAINLELPWNPIRLEQRIGRVDRLGQTRTVHAIHLFAKHTAESSVLARLVRRVERIRESLAFENPLFSPTEREIALEMMHASHVLPS